MPLCEKPVYIHEPTPLQCGQAVLSMLSGETVDKIIKIVGTERETDLNMMYRALDTLGIRYEKKRVPVNRRGSARNMLFKPGNTALLALVAVFQGKISRPRARCA